MTIFRLFDNIPVSSEGEKIPLSIVSTCVGATWKYNFSIDRPGVSFLELFTYGHPFPDFIPPERFSAFSSLQTRIDSYYRMAEQMKIVTHNILDVIPPKLISNYMDIYGQTCREIISLGKPEHYNLFLDYQRLITNIAAHPVQFKGKPETIKYSLFRNKTGRTSVEKGSFFILGLPHKERHHLIPTNDYFLELDFNGAEVRSLIALLGREQPKTDIHEFHIEKMGGKMTRDEAKKKFFAWLYNSEAKDPLFDSLYPRDIIVNKYFSNGIETPFGYHIDCDRFHALNYLMQSAIGFALMERSTKIHKLLKGRKSRISFLIYDSIILDMNKHDWDLLPELIETFSETTYGKFLVNVKKGPTFGNMESFRP
jgi:hypothetical protein